MLGEQLQVSFYFPSHGNARLLLRKAASTTPKNVDLNAEVQGIVLWTFFSLNNNNKQMNKNQKNLH